LASERSPAARKLAERALVWLVHELGDRWAGLVVLGGLVPETLVDESLATPQHLGTTDVDVHVDFGISPRDDLLALEDALLRLGFSPSDEGWRWKGAVEEAEIKLEFLCELDDQAERSVFQPPGCKRLGALNLRGTGFVSQDYVLRPVTGRLRDGAEVTVEVAFADVGGFLLAKAVALRERAAEKDYYDFVYVLLFNRLGGPAAAARAIRARGLRLPSSALWREVAARFHDAHSLGPRAYSIQALQANPDGEAATLKRDAVAAVREFLEELGVA